MTGRTTIIALASIVACAGLLAGCGRHSARCADPDRRAEYAVKMISGKLDLNDAQKAKLGEIKTQVLARFREARAGRAGLHGEMLALVKSPSVNRDQLNRIAEKREEDYRMLKPFILDKLVEFHSMLSQEQKNKLADLVETMHKRHGEG